MGTSKWLREWERDKECYNGRVKKFIESIEGKKPKKKRNQHQKDYKHIPYEEQMKSRECHKFAHGIIDNPEFNRREKYDSSNDIVFDLVPDGVTLRIFGTDPRTGIRREYSDAEHREYHRRKVEELNAEFGLAPPKWRQ